AVVTFADSKRLAAHRQHLDLPFPVLGDPDRELYRRFGFGRGSLFDVWSPGTMATYARLLRRGRRLRRPTEDTRQLGGDVVIGPDGKLASIFRPRSPDERPTVQQLIEAVTDARSA
ncbi:MAG: AhpC/TSA family protein, partial [Actinomycetota bacterium]